MQTHQLTAGQEAEYKQVFNLLDKNKDGTISTSELGTAMKSSGRHPTESDLEDMVRSVDTDESGTLNFTEFLTLMIREVMKPEIAKLRGIFSALDTNKDGTITEKEARQGLKKSGYSMIEIDNRLEKLFKKADFDKDGKIKFEG